jgi:peptidoglycan/xylan/chitin deacetylase (PgdA/CDA1 family)
MEFSGNTVVDAQLRLQAEEIFGIEEEVCYASFANGIYFSTVFQREGEIYPVVYNLDTAEPVSGSDLIKDTYFAVVKERLQNYVKENFPEDAKDEFVSYNQLYQAEDYQKFYMTKEQLVFCFEEGTLSANHPAFTYACDLEEAKAFFKNNLDGSANGPGIRELDPNAKMIAITFDDGPYPKVENQILELFEKYNGRATFFFLGQRIDDWYPDMPGTAYAAGHEVGSHTYSHELDFARASVKEIWSEINQTNLAIARSTGYAPDYVRFPGGSAGKKSLEIPMVVVNWNMDSLDYKYKKQSDGAEVIFDRLVNHMDKAADGGIVLMHSIYQNSFEGVEKFVEYLVEEGYELVTLSELFYYKGVTPEFGAVYQDGSGRISKKK